MADAAAQDSPADQVDQASAEAALAEAVTRLPAEVRAMFPTSASGEPQVELVRALYRYEHPKPGEVRWIQMRELGLEEWDAAVAAHGEIYRLTHGLDRFPSFAWGDLKSVRDELLRQAREHTLPDEWMAPLVEYRFLNYSTALKLYQEYVRAEINRTSVGDLKAQVEAILSEAYDGSFGYRLMYSMRNAFQHGVGGLVSLQVTARLVEGPNIERESEAHAYLEKEAFSASGANATVRQNVRDMRGDVDLFLLGEEAFASVQRLHALLIPLLHPAAPAAAQLLEQYMAEIGGERPHFHQYIRGLPTQGLLETRTLDRSGFDYVVGEAGKQAIYEEGGPTGPLSVLPSYQSFT